MCKFLQGEGRIKVSIFHAINYSPIQPVARYILLVFYTRTLAVPMAMNRTGLGSFFLLFGVNTAHCMII